MDASKTNVQITILKNGDDPKNTLRINADEQLLALANKGIPLNEYKLGGDKNNMITYEDLTSNLKSSGITLTSDEDKALGNLYVQIFGKGPKVSDLDKNNDGILTFNELHQVFAEKGYNLGIDADKGLGDDVPTQVVAD